MAKWFIPETLSEEAVRFLDQNHELAAPDLLWPEMGNLLWKKARAGEVTSVEADRILQALERCPISVFPSLGLLSGAFAIALATQRSMYDSLYLALAVALECAFVTADQRLVNALKRGPLGSYVMWVAAADAV